MMYTEVNIEKKKKKKDKAQDKIYHKVKDHCRYTREYGGAAPSIYKLKFIVPEEILINFYN